MVHYVILLSEGKHSTLNPITWAISHISPSLVTEGNLCSSLESSLPPSRAAAVVVDSAICPTEVTLCNVPHSFNGLQTNMNYHASMQDHIHSCNSKAM